MTPIREILYALTLFVTCYFLGGCAVPAHTHIRPLTENHVAYAPTTYTASGVETTFTIVFPYLREAHVTIKVDNVAKDHTFSSDGLSIILDVATAGDEAILIERTTGTTAVVTWTDGTAQTETDLTDAYNQTLYLVEETDFRVVHPNRVYSRPTNGIVTVSLSIEADIIGMRFLVIPGADGVKKYRVNYRLSLEAAASTHTGVIVHIFVGPAGGKADGDSGRVHVAKVDAPDNGDTGSKYEVVVAAFEITPATSDKVGLSIQTFGSSVAVKQTSDASTGTISHIEVVEIRE